MRNPGTALPVTPGFMESLTAGPSAPPAFLDNAIAPSFMTPDQQWFRAMRKRFGGPDDPDVGNFNLAQIDWDKDGTATVSSLEAGPNGWYGGYAPGTDDAGNDCEECQH